LSKEPETARGCTRREFLQSGGMAVAGLALAPRLAAVSETTEGRAMAKSSRKVRMGVVGGGFGCAFYWHQHPNCVVQAVSDLKPARREGMKSVFKCDNAYSSLEELIKDKDVDAVAVFTGAPDHVKHSIACMKAGKHVVCAVPAAMSLEELEELMDTVRKTGLTYMMAETSYYGQQAISARKFWQEGKFGRIFYSEAEYNHPGSEDLMFDENGRTWRYGFPPMHYPTHATAFLIGTTGERLTEVMSLGFGDDSPYLKDNVYKNPFRNESALFKTDQGNAMRVTIHWKAAVPGCERAQFVGEKMSFYMDNPLGLRARIVRTAGQKGKDAAGYDVELPTLEEYKTVEWYKTDMLPEALRHNAGHGGAEVFLTHEFIDALVNQRRPAIDVYEAVAYTAPGIVAHQSSLQGGKQMRIPGFDRKA